MVLLIGFMIVLSLILSAENTLAVPVIVDFRAPGSASFQFPNTANTFELIACSAGGGGGNANGVLTCDGGSGGGAGGGGGGCAYRVYTVPNPGSRVASITVGDGTSYNGGESRINHLSAGGTLLVGATGGIKGDDVRTVANGGLPGQAMSIPSSTVFNYPGNKGWGSGCGEYGGEGGDGGSFALRGIWAGDGGNGATNMGGIAQQATSGGDGWVRIMYDDGTVVLGIYELRVFKTGNGGGTITSGTEINCGNDCSQNYTSGAMVTLVATPASGSVFAGWSGACAGLGTCTLTMNEVKLATAKFDSTLCDDSQTILRINSETNAHAEVFNGLGNYPVRICYDRIFGKTYTGGSPHNPSTGNANAVLGLSASTNAHVAQKNTAGYPDVYYGDLTCRVVSGTAGNTNGCTLTNEKFVLSMSALTNAHVAKGGDYAYKLCCAIPSAPVNPPVAIVTNPEHRQIYFVDVPINFISGSTGGSLTETWRLFDGDTGPQIATFAGQSYSYTFTSTGIKRVNLMVNNAQGTSSKEISILVLGNSERGMFAYVNTPAVGAVVESSSYDVGFSASESYVVESVINSNCNGNPTVSCLAGNCPTKTKNVPATCTGRTYFDVSTPNRGFGGMNFAWTFSDGAGQTDDGLVNPINKFNSEGAGKWAQIVLKYPLTGTQINKVAKRIFRLRFTGTASSGCLNHGSTWADISGGLHSTLEDAGFCAVDGILDSLRPIMTPPNDCCPTGTLCLAEPTTALCLDDCATEKTNGNLVAVCDDYNNILGDLAYKEQQCKGDCNGVAEASVADGVSYTNAWCEWKDNKCSVDYTLTNPVDLNLRCVQTTTIGGNTCNNLNEIRTITYTVTAFDQNGNLWPVPGVCPPGGETTLPCRKSMVALPAFGAGQAIIVLVLVAIAYLVIVKTDIFSKKSAKSKKK